MHVGQIMAKKKSKKTASRRAASKPRRSAKAKKLTRTQARAILAKASKPKGRKPRRVRISSAALSRRTAKAAGKRAKHTPAGLRKSSTPPLAPGQLPPPMQLMQMLMGFMVTKGISAAAKLGIADQLAAGPRYYVALASALGVDNKALHRLMRGLSSVGVFTETAPGTYGLTPISNLLRAEVPGSLRSMAVMITTPSHWLPWGKFEETVRKGVSVLEEIFGQPLWEYYRQNTEEAAWFNGAMSDFSSMSAAAVTQAYDFTRFKRIVDIGGGHGFLLTALLRAAPKARGVLFDLPQVVISDKKLPVDVAQRVETSPGDFFRDVPGGGDCYTLKHVIHDWPDVQCRQILQNIRMAMKPGAKVLILDQVMPAGISPHPGFMMDLNMLAMTPGGRERTEGEFRALLSSAGLRLARVIPTPSPVSIVEAIST